MLEIFSHHGIISEELSTSALQWWREAFLHLHSCLSLGLLHCYQSMLTPLTTLCQQSVEDWKQNDGLPYLFAGEVGWHSIASISVHMHIAYNCLENAKVYGKGNFAYFEAAYYSSMLWHTQSQGKVVHGTLLHRPRCPTRWGWSWQLWAPRKGRRTLSWIPISGKPGLIF